jgi:hypothetical protein
VPPFAHASAKKSNQTIIATRNGREQTTMDRRNALSLTTAALLGACASGPPEPVYTAPVRTITLLPASNPTKVTFENSSLMSGLGPIFAAAHRSSTQSTENDISNSVGIAGAELGRRLTDIVVAQLRAAGYQVEVHPNHKQFAENVDVRTIPITTDAILQLSVSYVGVYSRATSNAFHPEVATYGILYRNGSRRPQFSAEIHYGTGVAEGKEWGIRADQKYAKEGRDAFLSSLGSLHQFFATGTEAAAQRLAAQLVGALK